MYASHLRGEFMEELARWRPCQCMGSVDMTFHNMMLKASARCAPLMMMMMVVISKRCDSEHGPPSGDHGTTVVRLELNLLSDMACTRTCLNRTEHMFSWRMCYKHEKVHWSFRSETDEMEVCHRCGGDQK